MRKFPPILLPLAALTAATTLSRLLHFAYLHQVFPADWSCSDVPPGSTVLALGFEHLGEVDGRIRPGAGNRFLARQLAECSERIDRVVTQKAISDAMEQDGLLSNGRLMGSVPVEQMHPHQPGKPVRTLDALKSAVQQLDPLPAALVLLAHDKQVERAAQDLRAVYDGQVLLWKLNGVPYARPVWAAPLRWALRELLIARPAEWLLRRRVSSAARE